MNYVQLLEQVKEELDHYFQLHEKPPLPYHNRVHTERVVAHAGQIARHYQLNDYDFFVVITAAWFHDTGYYINGALHHEMAGASMAADFLKTHRVDEKTIEDVKGCILATTMPQSPTNLLEQILCDADLFHFGTSDFPTFNKLMRKEASMRTDHKKSKSEWRSNTIKLLETHQFKTEYARNLLQEKKRQNIAALKEKEQEDEPATSPAAEQPVQAQPATELVADPEILKNKKTKRRRSSKPWY